MPSTLLMLFNFTCYLKIRSFKRMLHSATLQESNSIIDIKE